MTMQVYRLPQDKVTYNYRYFIPYAPEWGTRELCDRRLKELIAFCQEAKIDAVQFFVNILPGTYYMPAHNAKEQEHYAKWMKESVAVALREIGVSYQLNFQMLLGAQSHELDMRQDYDWGFLVNHHGQETLGCACPLSDTFRRNMREMLQLWAGTNPDILWIDDDFRMHNHGQSPGGELDYYCFCDKHLAEFAKITGKKYSREELVGEILKTGKPTKIRLQWLEFLGNMMTELAKWINRCVQGISPKTRLALMTSCPDVHSAEGRDWKSLLTALSGPYTPMTRPMSGLYTGTTVPVKQNACTYKYMSQSMTVLKRILGDDNIEFGPELENTRFTTWCKSVSNSQYVMILGQLLGAPQITLSLNDLDGSPISHEPTTVPLLKETKPRLEALAKLKLSTWKSEGVFFIDDENSATKVHLPQKAKMLDLGLIREWEDILLQCGIPAYHGSCGEAAKTQDIVVLEGYTAWLPSDREMKLILSKAVLLDAEACFVLQERGLGEYLGISVDEKATFGCQSEKFLIGTINQHDLRIPHRGFRWRVMHSTGAEITSELIDARNNYHPGGFIFENSLGGRVGIYNGIGEFSYGFFGYHARIEYFHNLFNYLSRGKFLVLPVIPHHCLSVIRTNGDEFLIALANLGTDPLTEVRFQVNFSTDTAFVKSLNSRGKWIKPEIFADSGSMRIKCNLNVFEWLIVKGNIKCH